MGMAYGFYRIRSKDLIEIKSSILNDKEYDLSNLAVDSFFLEKTYEGVQYIFNKGYGESLKIVFEPTRNYSKYDFSTKEFKDLSEEEKINYYIKNKQESYIEPEQIKQLKRIAKNIDDIFVMKNYDSSDMNKKNVYPGIWNDRHDLNEYVNVDTLKKEIRKLVAFIMHTEESDFIIVRCE